VSLRFVRSACSFKMVLEMQSLLIWGWFLIGVVSVNLPWLSDRLFFAFPVKRKASWMRWCEWLAFSILVTISGRGAEFKLTGTVHGQDWEYYVVMLCLLLVGAFPSFVWFHHKLGARRTMW